jgi:Transposase IS200 like
MLGTARRRDLFLKVLEEPRQRYQFVVAGYVAMPEHFHLLISAPEKGDPSLVMKVGKQRFARMVRGKRFVGTIGSVGGWRKQASMAEAFLRLQRVERAQACGEVALHAPQSSKTWVGSDTGAVDLEQLPAHTYGETGRVRVNVRSGTC